MEEILERAKKVAEEAEVFAVISEETTAHFEANRLKHIQSKQSSSTALRLIMNGKIGYAAITGEADSQGIVDMAADTAQFGISAEFEFPVLATYPDVEVFDPAVEKVPVNKMVELGEELIAIVREHTLDIVCEAGVSRATGSVRVINSRGGQGSYRESAFRLGIEGTLINDTDMLFVSDNESSCHPLSEIRPLAGMVSRQLELAKNQATVASRSMPVIFTPHGVASAIVSPLMTAFNGKTVLEGASPVGSRLGHQVFDKKLSLWDDSTIDYCPSSSPCDDEGVASQRTALVERGTVSSFFYDLQTAAQAGTRSTGNGSRGRGGLLAPAPTAFVFAPGDTSFENMVSDVRDGLVVEYLMGAGQGNVLGGDFSGNVLLGYKVENGKMVGRVKDTMVSGNVYQVLEEIAAVGDETRWVGGFLQAPAIYCPNLSVASK